MLKQASILTYWYLVENYSRMDTSLFLFFNKSDVIHLPQSLRNNYTTTVYWSGKICGITFAWKYLDGYVDVSMPFYVQILLQTFHHKPQ